MCVCVCVCGDLTYMNETDQPHLMHEVQPHAMFCMYECVRVEFQVCRLYTLTLSEECVCVCVCMCVCVCVHVCVCVCVCAEDFSAYLALLPRTEDI